MRTRSPWASYCAEAAGRTTALSPSMGQRTPSGWSRCEGIVNDAIVKIGDVVQLVDDGELNLTSPTLSTARHLR